MGLRTRVWPFLAVGLWLASGMVAWGEDKTSRVNCFIGTGGNGHCFPAAAYPFGLVQAGPDTGWGTWDYCSGYRYEDRQITMFSQTHNPGGGCPDYADVGIMPFVGEVSTNVVSAFSHANETASPGYYAVTLDRGNIRVEVSATERASIYRIAAPEAGNLRLLVDLDYGMGNLTWAKKTVKPLKVERLEDGTIRAHLLRSGFVKGRHIGVELKVNPAPVSVEELPAEPGVHAPKFILSFGRPADGRLIVKCGLSVTDGEGASRNLTQEIPDWDFDAVRLAARQKWREVLSRIEVEDDDADRAAMFETAVYHLFLVPTNIADVDGRTRGGDGKFLRMPNGRYYSELSLWDTFRGAHPLYTLVAAEYVPDFVNSMIAHQQAVGFLPVLPKWGRDSQCMIGTHAVSVIADAYFKGFCGVDWQSAYAAVRATLRETHPTRGKENWDLLDAYGYYPCDKLKGEGVSRTLECSYDDWCAWKMAEKLGTADDVAFFRKRAHNWTNVFDRATGFMRGRLTTGAWREPFDPFHCGHESSWAGDFTEGNAWQWRWHVLQDPSALVDALGGKEKTAALLDELFSLPSDLDKAHTSPDVTGLLGQYVQGNEPSHHIPYLYQYAGRPDRAAERIRQLCEKFYFNRPDGLCGNEDHGEMSAWYVFACLGFYPVNPASGEYVIGAPQVKRAVLRLPDGKVFEMTAKNLSKENRHVKSVTLNGRPVADWRLRHADIVAGGRLEFEMCGSAARTASAKLCEDERGALAFLDQVTGAMSAADEREWWEVGGSQHGIFAKRYSIAFAGYAAAALGMRGDAESSNVIVRVLGNCIDRMLRRDVWAYSQSKNYWGKKPWAPDPCYRENVMYTGHLLQLMALYEAFSGDRRYWSDGFDFVWSGGKVVHYDLKKLIEVTVRQMHENESGGVTCEPGLLFFPCNSHPHYALKLFGKLGHGDWTNEARKWEAWSMRNFQDPFFGGGALNLVCHVKTGLFYPRGNGGLDGWSALWYEAWAERREDALRLWRKASERIDWKRLEAAGDATGGRSCSDPQPVSPAVMSVFLAAAARANDDPATAMRLERAVDARYLVRTGGRYYLNLDREWRVGASAQRILALALANGSSFRRFAERSEAICL